MTSLATPDRPRPPRGRRVLPAAVLILLLAGAAAGWWWTRPHLQPLEPGWTARVVVIAGDGQEGSRDGHPARARFTDPFGVAITADETIYVADGGDAPRIRRIAPDGRVSTFAGGERGFADGTGASARFDSPSALALDPSGMLYVADTGNNAVRRIAPDGRVTTLAGDGTPGFADGPARGARFNGPIGVAVDGGGRVIVADTYNDRIRLIEVDGTVRTLAGSGEPGAVDGSGPAARFDTPSGVAVGPDGQIFVADTANGLVRTIDPEGAVSTAGPPLPAGLLRPAGIAAGPDGEIYVTDDRGWIVEIAAGGIRVVAGSRPGFLDGPGPDARFRRPSGIAVAGPGRLVVADTGNALVRLAASVSHVDLRPPAPPRVAPRFDDEAFGRLPLLWPVPPMGGPHEIAGTLGETRGGAGAERFHAGIDVREIDGTPVHAVREGTVVAPIATGDFGTLNEWLRVGPLTYVHVRVGRTRRNQPFDGARFVPTYDDTGRLVRMRAKRGARFGTGDTVATINAFNHVHLNVGWPGEEHNPLRFRLAQFEDTVPPTIARGGVRLFDATGQGLTRRARGRTIVSGQVRIVVDAWDRVDGNLPHRRLGLYALGYQILRADSRPAPGFDTPLETITFDRLAVTPDAARLVYASGSGIPFYGRRVTRFLYTVTNTLRDGRAAESFWDTTLHPAGDYIVRILASDFNGNQAVENRDLPVTIVHAEDPEGTH